MCKIDRFLSAGGDAGWVAVRPAEPPPLDGPNVQKQHGRVCFEEDCDDASTGRKPLIENGAMQYALCREPGQFRRQSAAPPSYALIPEFSSQSTMVSPVV